MKRRIPIALCSFAIQHASYRKSSLFLFGRSRLYSTRSRSIHLYRQNKNDTMRYMCFTAIVLDDANALGTARISGCDVCPIAHLPNGLSFIVVRWKENKARHAAISSSLSTNSLPLSLSVALSDNETRVTSRRRKETARCRNCGRRPHLARQYDSINDRATIRTAIRRHCRIIALFFLASLASARC